MNGTLVTSQREAIVSKDVKTLLEDLRAGKLMPSEVLEAYQAKALLVDKDINAVCDYILEASEWANDLAQIPEGDRGPLYGLPISVKECEGV